MTEQEARDDEREALVKACADAIFAAGLRYPESTKAVIALKSVLADRKHPEPEITDEMVERAAQRSHRQGSTWPWGELPPAVRVDLLSNARAVLEAALRVPVGEGEQSDV